MKILGIGEAMLELDAEASLASAPVLTCQVGGDVYNTLVAATRLGSPTAFITQLAMDGIGQRLLQHFTDQDVDTQWVQQLSNGHNGLYIAAVNPDKSHEFLYYRQQSAASRLHPDVIRPQMMRQAKIVYATGVTQAISPSARQTVLKAFQLAKQHNVMVAYDPNYRPALWGHKDKAMEALIEVLPYVDVILPSTEDMRRLFGFMDAEDTFEYFWAKGVPLVVLKQGEQGVTLWFKNTQQAVTAYPAESILDTIGAGDAFNGGFLHGLHQQKSLLDCARIGTIVASFSLQERGPIIGLPRARDVEAVLGEQRQDSPVSV